MLEEVIGIVVIELFVDFENADAEEILARDCSWLISKRVTWVRDPIETYFQENVEDEMGSKWKR